MERPYNESGPLLSELVVPLQEMDKIFNGYRRCGAYCDGVSLI